MASGRVLHLLSKSANRRHFSSINPLHARTYRVATTRCFATGMPKVDLWDQYQKAKQAIGAEPQPEDRDPTAVYCNNELDMTDIDVYGFDYDYTLASYKPTLHYLIYNLGRDKLVNKYKYPKDLLSMEYDPSFSVRGLHCDVRKGLLLKIDAFHSIQMGTVYRGRQCVEPDEVRDLYSGAHVGIDSMSSFHGTGPNMHQLMDLFALPEMTLYSNAIEYFRQNNMPFDAEYVFYDVRSAVQGLHSSGILHNEIMQNIGVFLDGNSEVVNLLQRLSAAGKKLFLITNSGLPFVDKGMRFLIGNDWTELFDVIITSARKPKFFYETSRPFRQVDVEQETKSWDRVTELKKGQTYEEGNLFQLRELTGWYGSRVLYFGDHVYSDLADATLKHGWRTGAIIPELEDEIRITNTPMYKSSLSWLITLEGLVSEMQVYEDAESEKILKEWTKERNNLREVTKNVFNKQFGSVFRTFHNPTYFTRRLCRFADVYTSSVTNLLKYPLKYTFYPRRGALPHEVQYPSTYEVQETRKPDLRPEVESIQ